MLSKPGWLLYADEVRQKVDALPARKNFAKRYRILLGASYYEACDRGYEGSFHDWQFLVERLGKMNARCGDSFSQKLTTGATEQLAAQASPALRSSRVIKACNSKAEQASLARSE
jgi:hypothetical protein